jgi:hypothetical protein
MNRVGMATLALLLVATAAQAKLEIQDIKAAFGPLGPERKSLEVQPFDDLLLRFTVSGLKCDDEGKMDVTEVLKLTDADGKVLLEQKLPIKDVLPLGGNRMNLDAHLNVGDKIPEGTYSFSITVKDNLADESVSFDRKVTAKAPSFSLVSPEFFYDPDYKVFAPAGGVVGQKLHFRMKGVGFDKSPGKVDAEMTIQLLDAKGKEVMPKPITVKIASDDPEVVKKANFLTLNGQVALNRAGDFTLVVKLTDKLAKKTVELALPVKVIEP